jgi:hypothetical protein
MTPPARLLHRHSVLANRGEARDNVAAGDFDLIFEAALSPGDMPHGALAYGADFTAERLLYTLLPDAAGALRAPFLFGVQLQTAQSVVTVPFERLAELPGADNPCVPVFIFSPGRAGSTLLSRLLHAVGAGCASEPDFPTQLCRLESAEQARLTPSLEQAVLRAGMQSLAALLGPALFVKLRSQCNARPDLFMAALPRARPVFLFRRHSEWALSRHRAFAEPPDMVADILRTAVVAVDRLTRGGWPPDILWFEDLAANPAGLLADLLRDRVMSRRTLQALIAPVMAEDSQHGTALARDVIRAREVDAAFLAGFHAEWAERRPTHHLGRRLEGLLAMLEQPSGVGPF